MRSGIRYRGGPRPGEHVRGNPDRSQSPEVVQLEDAERSFNLGSFAELNSLVPLDDLRTTKVVTDVAAELQRSPSAVVLGLERMADDDQNHRRFFPVIDVPTVVREALDEPGAEPSLERLAPIMEDLDRNLLAIDERTTYSPPDQGLFSTNYPEVNANLRCDWVTTFGWARCSGTPIARRKRPNSRIISHEHVGKGHSPDESPPDLNDQPPTLTEEGDEGIERQFLIAGRPCSLTYMCDDQQVDCSSSVVDKLVENVILITVGDEQ